VAIRTVKLAEDDDQVVIRLQELGGRKTAAALRSLSKLSAVTQVSGLEKPLRSLKCESHKLALDLQPYELCSLAVKLAPPATLAAPASVPVDLPFNLNVCRARGGTAKEGFDRAGAALPAEMLGDAVVCGGVTFRIGSRLAADRNAVSCQGQTISLPGGSFNRLYILAAAAEGDAEGVFVVDGNQTILPIQDWTGYIGQWDNRVFQGTLSQLTYSLTNQLDHIDGGFIKRAPLAWFCSHQRRANGSDAIYSYSYLFEYAITIPPGAARLTLPNNPNIRVLAVTVAQNDNDATQSVRPLYDELAAHERIALR
jgi:alpha-mannosidase